MASSLLSSQGLELSSVFDTGLLVLFPLAVLFVCYRLGRDFHMAELRELISFGFKPSATHKPFSLGRAYQSYAQYVKMSASELSAMRASYGTLGRAHKRLGNKIRYPVKLDTLQYATNINAIVADGIVSLAAKEFGLVSRFVDGAVSSANGDLGRVREAFKHYVRDWSTDGANEREKIFAPILSVLNSVDPSNRSNSTVLVPGCGLGRLAWEISNLGFDTTANELSYFMILAFRFLVSPGTTAAINEHTIHPYAHWFSHQRSNDALFRPVRFPDILPRLSEKFRLVEGDFLRLSPPPSATPSDSREQEALRVAAGYDFVITLFFIDTSQNVLQTMGHIYRLLKPGGAWINLGPLLWTGGAQTKLELSLEEVFAAANHIGFVDDSSIGKRTVECEYTSDMFAMMRWIYKAEFWVMRKPI